MRILYVALDQKVPGTLGGSVHVQEVATGLAALGHEVHVAVTQGGPWPEASVTWHAMPPPFGVQALRWTRTSAVTRLATRVDASVIIERYYNFGGEGVFAARRLGLPAVLEVNSPVIDYPGSSKSRIDHLLLVQPLRRWRDRICRHVDLFVTPLSSILPDWIDRRRVLEVEWGADTTAFHPPPNGTPPFPRDPSQLLCVFAGAFRSWHGVAHLTSALARLHAAGDRRFSAILIGDGPERAAVERDVRGVSGVTFTGAVPHADLPRYLAAADIGVAPFDPLRHQALQLGFYWSPLKVFEYMASGLPVVAPRLPRLSRLIEHGREGWLYDPDDPRGLDKALVTLADATLRARLGAAARDRAVTEFSWQAHCRKLDERLQLIVRPRRASPRAPQGGRAGMGPRER
jgi:glycosyltransferase involved in cell wall biosynthesis